MRKYCILFMAVALLLTASQAGAALVSDGFINLHAVRPTGYNGYVGGGVAFVPASADALGQDTLVVNWAVTDTVNTSQKNQVFQRITIPSGGGIPTVLATATLRYDMLYDGTNQYGTVAGADLAFDAVNNKLVYTGTTGNRFINFDLFSTDTSISSVGYSAPLGDSSSQFGQAIAITPAGDYMSFYKLSANLKQATISPSDMSGGAMTKTTTPISAFTDWYPLPDGYPYTVNGYNSSGAVLYGDSYLVLRNFKNSATPAAQEAHLYQVDSDFDAAAINAHVDLGNAQGLANPPYGTSVAWGLTADPAAGKAFLRYGYVNQAGGTNSIQIVTVPEPMTLGLLLTGLVWPLVRRRNVA